MDLAGEWTPFPTLASNYFASLKGWEGNLAVVGADGCDVNTGHEHGALV